jgi:hypothetical protein
LRGGEFRGLFCRQAVGHDRAEQVGLDICVDHASGDRMLMLTQLHANGRDDVHNYTHLIRACLQGNAGRPGVDRRSIVDPKSSASLR